MNAQRPSRSFGGMPDNPWTPLLIIVNGLPGSGKTTLANRLGHDLRLPVFSRDGIYEALVDALESHPAPPALGSAAFRLLYNCAAAVLAAGHPAVVEGFFGRPDLRTAEFLHLQRRCHFQPFQILCKASGQVLLERFLARAGSPGRHAAHADAAWLEHNRQRLLSGQLEPLALPGPLLEIDTSTPDHSDYAALFQQVRSALPHPP